jgi:hypothetical protein
MGLKDFFSRWSKASDREAIERAEQHTEDYEGQKADIRVEESFAGGEAMDVARDDLDAT